MEIATRLTRYATATALGVATGGIAVWLAVTPTPARAQMPAHPAATLLAVTDTTSVYVDLVNVHAIGSDKRQQYMVVLYTEPRAPHVDDLPPYAFGQLAETWLVDCRSSVLVRRDFTRRDLFGKELEYRLDSGATPQRAEVGTIAAGLMSTVCLAKRGHA